MRLGSYFKWEYVSLFYAPKHLFVPITLVSNMSCLLGHDKVNCLHWNLLYLVIQVKKSFCELQIRSKSVQTSRLYWCERFGILCDRHHDVIQTSILIQNRKHHAIVEASVVENLFENLSVIHVIRFVKQLLILSQLIQGISVSKITSCSLQYHWTQSLALLQWCIHTENTSNAGWAI